MEPLQLIALTSSQQDARLRSALPDAPVQPDQERRADLGALRYRTAALLRWTADRLEPRVSPG